MADLDELVNLWVLDRTRLGPQVAHNSTDAFAQVGWLGRSGTTYAMGVLPAVLALAEPHGHEPVFVRVGKWAYRGNGQYVIVKEGE